ncbi:hypothetical protein SMICM17S_08469 [Streptomyces microflavus]
MAAGFLEIAGADMANAVKKISGSAATTSPATPSPASAAPAASTSVPSPTRCPSTPSSYRRSPGRWPRHRPGLHHPPWVLLYGAEGGEPGRLEQHIERAVGGVYAEAIAELEAGDVLVVRMLGGGGYGPAGA